MQTFWNNILKFPRFLLGVFIGFFLTTFQPVFKSLDNKKKLVLIILSNLAVLYFIYIVLRLMLDIN
uniref:Uncharacterized protein ycf33 n=2 Tax=Gelidium TaxID=2811 RepID=A0A411FT85_9FLOR|nr:hypothetical protein [Gelidium coulteri]YP_009565339.1 hypothetical protein [Gelidium sinicola]QBA96290.1 hypothetical protein [Gelidium coulteri]QBA96690.1 hypothetical protein [Gelidium sinicola]